MGKGFRGGRGGGGGRGRGKFNNRGGGGRGGGGNRWAPRTEIKRTNGKYEDYYNELGIVDESEKEDFWESLRSDLPNSFRFAGSRGHALTVQRRLIDHYIPQITSVSYEGQPVAPPTPIEWFPDNLAWDMTTPKNVIRKFPPFASFQKFLVSENSVGNITRQEIVSMIPPLILDPKPGMMVLDLCAAPGSKSGQLIEMVHGGEEARVRKVQERIAAEKGEALGAVGLEVAAESDLAEAEEDYSDDGRPTGLLIANDVDYRRAQMLVHQCKRLNSPNLIVTNHDATLFPSIKLPSQSSPKYLKFDRVLADVPCSGDGTTRKNPNVWKDWNQANALGLHATQVRILVRALQMLKVGGRVVYSTCSMNPIENEAVVAAAVERCGGSGKVKLLDQSNALPALIKRSGMKHWKVMDRSGRWWDSWSEVVRTMEEQGEEGTSKLNEGMFPPKEELGLPLEHCIRIYPHLQNTGAFFIAALEKLSEIRARPENESKKAPAPASTSIVSIAEDIEDQTKTEANGLEKIDTLDDIAPPTVDDDVDEGDVPAAARQNAENPRPEPLPPNKRVLDDEADAAASTKRLKTQEDLDAPAPEGTENRRVHWPPPPAAELANAEHRENGSIGSSTTMAQPKKKNHQPQEEAFKYLDSDHDELLDIYDFYKLSLRFPRDRFMVRNATGQPVKAIYYTSSLTRDILRENEGKGIKFVHSGVKMFVKQDVQNQPEACKWRIQSEGLPIVEPWVGEERIVRLTKRETLRRLLLEMFPKIGQDGWRTLGEIGEAVRDLRMGCCVLRVEPSNAEDGFNERLVMPLWRGIGSLNLMLPKEERKATLLRLYNDNSELIDHSKDRKQQASTGPHTAPDKSAAGEDLVPEPDGVMQSEPFSDDEDGGVPLNGYDGNGDKDLGPPLDEKAMLVEDVAEGELQNQADQTREAAPGVVDEDDSFNKTV